MSDADLNYRPEGGDLGRRDLECDEQDLVRYQLVGEQFSSEFLTGFIVKKTCCRHKLTACSLRVKLILRSGFRFP